MLFEISTFSSVLFTYYLISLLTHSVYLGGVLEFGNIAMFLSYSDIQSVT